MKAIQLAVLTMMCTLIARADFSYTQTRKSAQGVPGGAGDQVTKHYLKGQKMKMDNGKTATIFDFGAQTVTMIDNQAKTYTVTPFAELMKGAGPGVQQMNPTIDVKETGQKKNINGYSCNEVVMTIAVDNAGPGAAQGMKAQMEVDSWLSSDVPGAAELRSFYQKNGERFPWMAVGGGQSSMQKAMADVMKKMSTIGGVPVQQVAKMKMALNPQQQAQMEQMRARMEEMKKAGGQQAAMAEQMMSRMGGMMGGGGSMFEVVTESSDFSTASIPDSAFVIPAGYTKK